ncbi:MAG: hypothetical protein AMXMBFR33_41250 [Candidatus Xenobia bacterium]
MMMTQQAPMRPLVRVREAAALLGECQKTTYERVWRGEFPAGVVIRLGRQIRFDPERLAAWLAAGGTASRQV